MAVRQISPRSQTLGPRGSNTGEFAAGNKFLVSAERLYHNLYRKLYPGFDTAIVMARRQKQVANETVKNAYGGWKKVPPLLLCQRQSRFRGPQEDVNKLAAKWVAQER